MIDVLAVRKVPGLKANGPINVTWGPLKITFSAGPVDCGVEVAVLFEARAHISIRADKTQFQTPSEPEILSAQQAFEKLLSILGKSIQDTQP